MIKESKYKKDLIKAVNRLTFINNRSTKEKKEDYELIMLFIDNRL